MGAFYKKIFLFLLPVMAAILVCFLWPVKERMLYTYATGDCDARGLEIYDRIQLKTNPIDLAFVGSSHTINGINDEVISTRMNNNGVVNLGYCRLGINMDHHIIQSLLQNHQPNMVILEVRERMNWFGHPVFYSFASNKEIIEAPLFFNDHYFTDLVNRVYLKSEIIKNGLWSKKTTPLTARNYFHYTNADTIQSTQAEKVKMRRQIQPRALGGWKKFYRLSYPMSYYKKIKRLCDEKQVKLAFIYLPGYGSAFTQPEEMDFYQNLGEVIIPPDQILHNRAFWYDQDHLNTAGSTALSEWLSDLLLKKQEGL